MKNSLWRNPFLYASVVLSVLLAFQIYGIVTAQTGSYVGPTGPPPAGNPAQPLDTSSKLQYKTGNLVIGTAATPNIELFPSSKIVFRESGNSVGQIYFAEGKLFAQAPGSQNGTPFEIGTGGESLWASIPGGSNINYNGGDVHVSVAITNQTRYYYNYTRTKTGDKWVAGDTQKSGYPCNDDRSRECFDGFRLYEGDFYTSPPPPGIIYDFYFKPCRDDKGNPTVCKIFDTYTRGNDRKSETVMALVGGNIIAKGVTVGGDVMGSGNVYGANFYQGTPSSNVRVPPSGTWCGLHEKGLLVWSCEGHNVIDSCPAGYEKVSFGEYGGLNNNNMSTCGKK